MKTKKNNILYVDDQSSNILIFKNLFGCYYDIFSSHSGAEGLKMIEQHQIELVVTNQSMPQMSGLEFLKKAKLKWPNIKSVLLLPYSDIDIVNPAIKDLIEFRYTNKPFDQIETKLLIEWAIELSLTEIEDERASKLLLNKSDKFHTTFSSTSGVFIRINKNGLVEMYFPSIYDLFDFKPEEVIGKKTSDNYVNNEDIINLIQKTKETGFSYS